MLINSNPYPKRNGQSNLLYSWNYYDRDKLAGKNLSKLTKLKNIRQISKNSGRFFPIKNFPVIIFPSNL